MENVPEGVAGLVPYVALAILLISIGIFFRNLSKWSKAGASMVSPMSITLKTDKTPEQVRQEAAAARRGKWMAILMLLFGAWLVILLFDDAVAWSIARGVVHFVSAVLQAIVELLSVLIEQLQVATMALWKDTHVRIWI